MFIESNPFIYERNPIIVILSWKGGKVVYLLCACVPTEQPCQCHLVKRHCAGLSQNQ